MQHDPWSLEPRLCASYAQPSTQQLPSLFAAVQHCCDTLLQRADSFYSQDYKRSIEDNKQVCWHKRTCNSATFLLRMVLWEKGSEHWMNSIAFMQVASFFLPLFVLESQNIDLSHVKRSVLSQHWTFELFSKKPDGFVIVVLTLFSVQTVGAKQLS